MKMKEVDLAAVVIKYLQAYGWDTHQEVSGIDIVAEKRGLVWGIECKLGLGLEVMEQAWRNMMWVHHSSVAVPRRKNWRLAGFAESMCRQQGIGVLQVDMVDQVDSEWHEVVEEAVLPRLGHQSHRHYVTRLRNRLCDDTRNYSQAGSPSPKEWTPFKTTCRAIRQYVARHPGCSTKQLVHGISHHYKTHASACGSLLSYARGGIIEGVKLVQGRPVRWFLEDVTKEP